MYNHNSNDTTTLKSRRKWIFYLRLYCILLLSTRMMAVDKPDSRHSQTSIILIVSCIQNNWITHYSANTANTAEYQVDESQMTSYLSDLCVVEAWFSSIPREHRDPFRQPKRISYWRLTPLVQYDHYTSCYHNGSDEHLQWVNYRENTRWVTEGNLMMFKRQKARWYLCRWWTWLRHQHRFVSSLNICQ